MLAAAVRWGWITSNPAEVAKKPRKPAADPDPPSTTDAARIVEAAWEISLDWGMFVWLVFVTGMRRAEVIALRWSRLDLDAGTVAVRRNWVSLTGQGGREKDTKSHQVRRLALDETTVELLREYRARYEETMRQLGEPISEDAYLFSYSPLQDRPYNPSGVTHKYARMCEKLAIDRPPTCAEALLRDRTPQRRRRPADRRWPARPRGWRLHHASGVRGIRR